METIRIEKNINVTIPLSKPYSNHYYIYLLVCIVFEIVAWNFELYLFWLIFSSIFWILAFDYFYVMGQKRGSQVSILSIGCAIDESAEKVKKHYSLYTYREWSKLLSRTKALNFLNAIQAEGIDIDSISNERTLERVIAGSFQWKKSIL